MLGEQHVHSPLVEHMAHFNRARPVRRPSKGFRFQLGEERAGLGGETVALAVLGSSGPHYGYRKVAWVASPDDERSQDTPGGKPPSRALVPFSRPWLERPLYP